MMLYDLVDDECMNRMLSSVMDGEFLLASNNPKKRAGRKKFSETRHPIYRGVRRRNSGKWVCELREPNKKTRIWLGTYPTVEMAARAHDVAAIALRGKSACLNFADSAWRLPRPASMETKDIQKAAAEAAESFRPSMHVHEVVQLVEVDQVASSEDVSSVEEEEVFSPENNVFLMEEEDICFVYREAVTAIQEDMFMIDEEDIFSMPWLIASMAEGLMLPPPLQYC